LKLSTLNLILLIILIILLLSIPVFKYIAPPNMVKVAAVEVTQL
jgi:hypothetical protein